MRPSLVEGAHPVVVGRAVAEVRRAAGRRALRREVGAAVDEGGIEAVRRPCRCAGSRPSRGARARSRSPPTSPMSTGSHFSGIERSSPDTTRSPSGAASSAGGDSRSSGARGVSALRSRRAAPSRSRAAPQPEASRATASSGRSARHRVSALPTAEPRLRAQPLEVLEQRARRARRRRAPPRCRGSISSARRQASSALCSSSCW